MVLLKDKVAIVTGASSGLGAATVKAFAALGVKVVATARRAERLAALRDEFGCEVFAGDAGDEATAEAVVKLAMERFGRVDVLVNNAGAGNYKLLAETTVAEYDELMRVNMRSSFLFSRLVVPGMVEQRSGTIVFVSSVAGVAGAAKESVYCATKFAQVGFAQSLDQELFPYGVKVTALIAGGMKTEFAIGKGREVDAIAASPMMEPEHMAEAIVFACSQPEGVRVPTLTMRHMGVRQ
jgi:NADP-dependent 3-hydroxy acid dehydrogenase YdfG